jgi:hypothetical protein
MRQISLIFSSILLITTIVCCSEKEIANDLDLKERKQLYPPDAELTDSSLFIFLDSLEKAIKMNDTNFIYAHIDSNIHLSFGGHVGIDDFKDLWNITEPDSRFWTEMEEIMNLGGEMVDTFYYSPYVSSSWQDVAEDGFLHSAIIDKNVNLYNLPDDESQILVKLDYEVVKEIDTEDIQYDRNIWCYVETLDKEFQGFVSIEKLRSPIDYRIIVKKYCDIWKIETLIAGD